MGGTKISHFLLECRLDPIQLDLPSRSLQYPSLSSFHPSQPTIPSKMFTQSVVLVFSACMAGYLALPQVYPDGESPNNQAYNLPADGETLLAQALSLSFSCDSREYGYYADVSNNCQIFHICLPIEDDAGSIIETAQWSFICGNGTVFDQQTLSCNYELDSVLCDQAESLYNLVEFGKNIRQGHV
eukprot:snap_masked-scaffold419_size176504-processed-gene-0.23 protein:Tk02020 transcript:snap_masked-scaffold419_size176504-processed-gene-0.23-mRNA-1 annotation:"cuticle protein"